MNVADLMTPSPAAVRATDPLSRAAELMRNGRFGLVPVVDEGGRPIGVGTPRDVCVATLDRPRPPQDIAVADAMKRGVATVDATATLLDAQNEMARAGVRRLPVVDPDGLLVGVIQSLPALDAGMALAAQDAADHAGATHPAGDADEIGLAVDLPLAKVRVRVGEVGRAAEHGHR